MKSEKYRVFTFRWKTPKIGHHSINSIVKISQTYNTRHKTNTIVYSTGDRIWAPEVHGMVEVTRVGHTFCGKTVEATPRHVLFVDDRFAVTLTQRFVRDTNESLRSTARLCVGISES